MADHISIEAAVVKEGGVEITTKQLGRVAYVQISGRFDTSFGSTASTALEQALEDAIGEKLAGVLLREDKKDRCYRVVLDMEEATYLDARALRALISILKLCRRWNRGNLRLVNVPKHIEEAMDLAGFSSLFEFYDDAVDAVASF